MTDTPRLALPAIEAAQAQKHVTHNEALMLLDALTHLSIQSRSLGVPPDSPSEGSCYIPAPGAVGAWSGWDELIALYSGGGWVRILPIPGMKAWINSERLTVTFEDGMWRDGIALTEHGGRVTLRANDEEIDLAGPFTDTTSTFIPDRAVVLGVASRTTAAITGATSYGVGVVGNTTQFGDLLGIAAGAVNNGVIGPTAFYADTAVRVSANGGTFASGRVRLILYFLEMSVPAS